MSDDEIPPERVAPSRKWSYLEEKPSSTPQCAEDESAEDMLQNVTGKRFSITQLFSKKSKKDANSKDSDSKKEQDGETTENEVKDTKLEKT